MEKTKLKNKRTSLGFSQEDLANYLATDKSNYCKKEKGVVKISNQEWQKLATFLSCEVDDIFEKEENAFLINSLNTIGDNNVYNAYNELAQETMKKYIAKLEEDNVAYKVEITALKLEIKAFKENS
jgi:DNA-binding XRE family transcriptional regulator